MTERAKAFERLATILDELRAQCPWDMKQTMESLRHLTIEETFELADSILDGDLPEIKKELGDIQLHLLFYAKIAEEKKAFDMTEVDRKSTRLNSSHMSISYAVFCLKKKNNKVI